MFGQAQVKLIGEVNFEGQLHTIDKFGNIYVANGPRLTRFCNKGHITADFRSAFAGNITFIDASNPLQILIFYRDFNQVLFLSKNLIELSPAIVLGSIGVKNAELVCASEKGGFWVLDWLSREVKYFNQDFKLLNQTSLHGILNIVGDNPMFMTEHNSRLYISFPKSGVHYFDRLGTYLSYYPLGNVSEFQINMNHIVLVDYNKVKIFTKETGESQIIELNIDLPLKSARIEGDRLFVFTEQKIHIFKIF